MSQACRVRFALAMAVVAAIGVCSGSVFAQLPNPYQVCKSWGQLPAGRTWGNVTGVGIDHHGNVWVVDRCGSLSQDDPCIHSNVAPIMEFDSTGKFLKSFGTGLFAMPHSLYLDKSDNVWVADEAAKDGKGDQVIEFSPEGKVLLALGKAGVYGGASTDAFNEATSVVVAPNGDIFVADGHAVTNTRIVKFSKDGKFVKAWGKSGTAAGEFHELHSIAMDSAGRVFVGDRGNGRIQIFDQDGKFLKGWKQFGEPRDIFIDANDTMYVTDEGVSHGGVVSDYGHSIRIGSAKDGVVTGIVPPTGPQVKEKSSLMRVATDAKGNLFVADFTALLNKCDKK